MKPRQIHFLVDLDGVLAIPLEFIMKKEYGPLLNDLKEKGLYFEGDPPHMICMGAFELLKYLFKFSGEKFRIKISFFSSGPSTRNIPLVSWLLKQALEKDFPEAKNIVFSKEHLDKQDGLFVKNLHTIEKEDKNLDDTILIDDDYTYIAKGQERNLLKISDTCTEFNLEENYLQPEKKEPILSLNQVFYITGMIDYLLKKDGAIADNLFKLQFNHIGNDIYHDVYHKLSEDHRFYLSGLKILQTFNPKLMFYGENALKQFTSADKTDLIYSDSIQVPFCGPQSVFARRPAYFKRKFAKLKFNEFEKLAAEYNKPDSKKMPKKPCSRSTNKKKIDNEFSLCSSTLYKYKTYDQLDKKFPKEMGLDLTHLARLDEGLTMGIITNDEIAALTKKNALIVRCIASSNFINAAKNKLITMREALAIKDPHVLEDLILSDNGIKAMQILNDKGAENHLLQSAINNEKRSSIQESIEKVISSQVPDYCPTM